MTNSVTRDAALTAGAALSLQVESDGRAVLGIGRGDSSVQRIGKAPDPVARFERYLAMVQTYLSRRQRRPRRLRQPTRVAAARRRRQGAGRGRRDRTAGDRDRGAPRRPHLLRRRRRPGAPRRRARPRARRGAAAGRDPATLRYGAFVNCVLHDDVAVARDALRGTVATFARFSAMRGSPLAQLPRAAAADASEYLRGHYDMREHTRADAGHAAGIDDAFVDWFAIAGPVERALPRFRALAALGLDFLHVVPSSTGVARDVAIGSFTALGRDLLPALAGDR